MEREDSTKGNSMIDPRSYKGELNVQVWLDSRKVAMISNWLDEEGRQTVYISEVVRECVDIVADHLIEKGWVKKIETVQVARDLLSAKYRTRFRKKGVRNRLHNSVLDDRRINSIYNASDQQYMKGVSNIEEMTTGNISIDVIKEAYKKAKEYGEEEKKKAIDKENSRVQYDENGLCMNNFVEPKQVIPEWAEKVKESTQEKTNNIAKNSLYSDKLTPAPIDVAEWTKKNEEKLKAEEEAMKEFNPLNGAIRDRI